MRRDTGHWDAPVPGLEWTVRQTVAHMANACWWYVIDLSAAGLELSPVEHRVKPESAPSELLATMEVFASLLALVIDHAVPEQRGFHPAGMADPSGFAAMACDELLIHTDDAARGLGLECAPPDDLVALTLRRLFPWAPADCPPWDALRWANGRIELPGRPRRTTWSWQCAPLAEWGGTMT